MLLDLTPNDAATLDERRSAGPRLAPEQKHFSVKRACPCCGTSFPEPDPRMFSYNSKHGWCPGCFGTGLQLKGFDAEQTGEETDWNAWYDGPARSEAHTSELQSLMRISYAVFCLKKNNNTHIHQPLYKLN